MRLNIMQRLLGTVLGVIVSIAGCDAGRFDDGGEAPTLTEVVEGSVIVRSTQRDELGSVESEIVDEGRGRLLAVSWHYPSDNRYDYATPLDDDGRARLRSVPMSGSHSLAEYNHLLVERYLARRGMEVERYEQTTEYRRGCVVPFAEEHVECLDHCRNECCTSLQQCLWEVEHTGDIAGLRASHCMHTAAMCHGTCGLCKLTDVTGAFNPLNGGDCSAPAIPGDKGEGLTCHLGQAAIAQGCALAWDTATNLSLVVRRIKDGVEDLSSLALKPKDGSVRSTFDIFGTVYDFVGDVKTTQGLVNPIAFPGSKCGCNMHPCFDQHCADEMLPEFAAGTTGATIAAKVREVLDNSYYCARDCQLDGPSESHACSCAAKGLEWCTEGSRRCADGLPAWDEFGDTARCQVSCDTAGDSACACRDNGGVLCRASPDCPTMADACVADQDGQNGATKDDCDIWRERGCAGCGGAGQVCCDGPQGKFCRSSSQVCGGGGVCVDACQPSSCNGRCGTVSDGCGSTQNCGTCSGSQICNAGRCEDVLRKDLSVRMNLCGSDSVEVIVENKGEVPMSASLWAYHKNFRFETGFQWTVPTIAPGQAYRVSYPYVATHPLFPVTFDNYIVTAEIAPGFDDSPSNDRAEQSCHR